MAVEQRQARVEEHLLPATAARGITIATSQGAIPYAQGMVQRVSGMPQGEDMEKVMGPR